jgi:hypothetical protein
MRSKIYRWYDEVKAIDKELESIDKTKYQEELEKLEKLRIEISNETKVPLSFMGEYYNLQLHIDHVINKIEKSI